MKVCEYSLFSALDEALYFVLQSPPLELHGNQLVGGHYWFSIIPPRFPTNKGVK